MNEENVNGGHLPELNGTKKLADKSGYQSLKAEKKNFIVNVDLIYTAHSRPRNRKKLTGKLRVKDVHGDNN